MFKTVVFKMGTFEIAQRKAVTRLIPDARRESLFSTNMVGVEASNLPSTGCFKFSFLSNRQTARYFENRGCVYIN